MTQLPEGWVKKSPYYVENSNENKRICGCKTKDRGWVYTPFEKRGRLWEQVGPSCDTLEEAYKYISN